MPRLIQRIGEQFHLRQVKHARTFGQRFMGLMGVSPGSYDYALVFHLHTPGKINASIHMLFMRFPIDVLFLDARQQVVDAVESLPPWTLNYTPKKDAAYIVELPAGTIAKHHITLHTPIRWT
ncbi:MAG: DUF192 domain-containing protein [Candidatus Iainarchaeum archaeon]|uniref:DUF192 domain-containing protein n=1 Tax=Candidatus Iainarchaeum sp. TaxID=3101447 RepID=A0A7T9DJ58_9ARCH|nr:MAG: DUF192 domain-containing protein [Candidatus Diapherotrites archaeon]